MFPEYTTPDYSDSSFWLMVLKTSSAKMRALTPTFLLRGSEGGSEGVRRGFRGVKKKRG
jgi:hypothetical protein